MSKENLYNEIKKNKKGGGVDLSFMKEIPSAGMSYAKPVTWGIGGAQKSAAQKTAQSTQAVPTEDTPSTLGFTGEVAKETVQGSMRAYAALGPLAVPGAPILTPEGRFQEAIYGTNKPITLRSVGGEVPFVKEEAWYAPAVGFAMGALDLIPGGKPAKDALIVIAKETNPETIAKILRETFKDLSDPKVAENLGIALDDVTDPIQVQQIIEHAISMERNKNPVTTKYWYDNQPKAKADEVVVSFVETGGDIQYVNTVVDNTKQYPGTPQFGVIKKSLLEDTGHAVKTENGVYTIPRALANQLVLENTVVDEARRVPIRGEGGQFLGSFMDEPAKQTNAPFVEGEYRAWLRNQPEAVKRIEDTIKKAEEIQSPKVKQEFLNDAYREIDNQFIQEYQQIPVPERTAFTENGILFDRTITQINNRLSDIFGRPIDIRTTTNKDFLRAKADKGDESITVYGRAKADAIWLLSRNKTFSEAVANHEGWHWFKRNLSDSKRKELDALEKELMDSRPDLVAKVKRDYPNATPQELAEEVMADEFARYTRTGRTVSEKLKVFFDNAMEALLRVFKVRDDVMSRVEKEFSRVKKTLKEDEGKYTVGEGANKQVLSEKEFKNFTDLSTRLLSKLEGKTTVSKQFISDLTNSPDLKQPERQLFRRILEDEGDKVSVKDFADRVKTELLPLDANDVTEGPMGSPRYESINLSDDLRGPVYNYQEFVYESPIKTRAGGVHFGSDAENYFAHTRIEDTADKFTPDGQPDSPTGVRRVLEVQSDLFQKGRLEGETSGIKEEINKYTRDAKMRTVEVDGVEYKTRPVTEGGTTKIELYPVEYGGKSKVISVEEFDSLSRESTRRSQLETKLSEREKELSRLEPYRNTWHERIVREEVKKAAQDGMKVLQFPTGETAMKIEGLGDTTRWSYRDDMLYSKDLKKEDLKVGMTVNQSAGGFVAQHNLGDRGDWIITDILGNGKFKAIPKSKLGVYSLDETMKVLDDIGKADIERAKETFDISGEVDENNPIFKFYEKEMGKYLKNKYGATRVTDAQGVSWYEVALKEEYGTSPVEAFKQVSNVDRLIAEGKIRVVSRDGRDVYQTKEGDKWVNRRDEDSALKSLEPKPKAPSKAIQVDPKLEERLLSAQISKEMLADNPLKELSKYAAKTGEEKGTLREVTGQADGKFAREGDSIITELGYKDTEEARAAYVEYRDRVADVEVEIKEAREAIKTARLEQKARQGESKAIAELTEPVYQRVPETPEAIRTLENQAQATLEAIDVLPNQKPLTLQEIVTQTPLSAKVNVIDYIRTPDRVLKKIGFKKEADLLRDGYDKYVVELPKNIQKITDWYEGMPKESGTRIFKYLDGEKIDLPANEQKVAEEIKVWLKEWADRLDLPQDNRITNYITHIFDEELIAKEFDEDLAKIITEKIPGQVYDPFLEKRLGAKGYIQDVWKALDAYTKRATRKVNIDPALKKIQDKAGSSLEFSNLEKSQFDYIQKYISRVNMRPTEIDNLIDTSIKQVFGYKAGQRPVARISRFLRQMTYRSFLGFNLGSAMRNLSQGINTYAVLGERDTALGYMKLFSAENRKELAAQGIFANNFIQDRSINATRKLIEKADKGLWVFFDTAEKINRGSAYLGAKTKALREGKSEQAAIDYAKEIVRKTQFNYDPVDTPVGLSSDIVKTLLQFQTYTTKQTEFLTELAKNKDFVALARYAIAGYAFVYSIGQAFGMEPKELLPINTDTWSRFELAPSLKIPKEIAKALMNVPDDYGSERDLDEKMKDIADTLWGLIPAGSQIKKTIKGYGAVEEGGSYDAAGRKQFEVGGTPATEAQAILFGKYANPEAKQYFDKTTGDTTLDTLKEADNKTKAEAQKNLAKDVAELSKASKEEAFARIEEMGKTDPDYAEKVIDALIEEKLGLTSTEKKLKKSSVRVRAEYISNQLEDMTNEERGALIDDYTTKGIMTESVLDELIKLRTGE